MLRRLFVWLLMCCILCSGTWIVIYNLLSAGSGLAIFGATWVGFFNLCGLIYTFNKDVLHR